LPGAAKKTKTVLAFAAASSPLFASNYLRLPFVLGAHRYGQLAARKAQLERHAHCVSTSATSLSLCHSLYKMISKTLSLWYYY
jgi:hypothetical protein